MHCLFAAMIFALWLNIWNDDMTHDSCNVANFYSLSLHVFHCTPQLSSTIWHKLLHGIHSTQAHSQLTIMVSQSGAGWTLSQLSFFRSSFMTSFDSDPSTFSPAGCCHTHYLTSFCFCFDNKLSEQLPLICRKVVMDNFCTYLPNLWWWCQSESQF